MMTGRVTKTRFSTIALLFVAFTSFCTAAKCSNSWRRMRSSIISFSLSRARSCFMLSFSCTSCFSWRSASSVMMAVWSPSWPVRSVRFVRRVVKGFSGLGSSWNSELT
ncbi:uncharacterized protein B0T15DRAFT_538120 [Chaetomium strumarium]|uniref:Secreted protein n=1 Tax=Chaetomium strumarium TaxID=1170767 RepID=A0AAJ0M0Y1_9PEZI|nr:hypothetical protein B0T15DRAFT_538120 [Chaetomium strumarium]